MHSLLIALATSPAPAPSPSLREGLTQDQVTPGLLGFLLTAFIVVLTALLIVDMVRRVRRVRYRAQVEEERMAAAGNEFENTAADPAATKSAPERGPAPDSAGRPGPRPDADGGPGSAGR
ncbi:MULTISPECIES: hypothetical protein [unclassified Arthrobacter]|uniref:hypothetical protein n=1 Tax=unclassified Arthrobacter TaxID=235627 RepID=UPI002E0CB2F4|nr:MULTISPECIES: hypothetical protein [unclassified Arthrobacter]MEC5190323.1 hypothetical protein [Arthrobacter sp. MP_M4]MEC5202696.1 hypothetical protein [Arthrobacter sp. MP_M7]